MGWVLRTVVVYLVALAYFAKKYLSYRRPLARNMYSVESVRLLPVVTRQKVVSLFK